MSELLSGIRIIDLTRVLAGPYCTMILGDLGADVIKVEMPGRGDDTRHWGPPFAAGGESAYFLSVNRNKRSLTLNLKSARGLAILKGIIRHGDGLIENFKAGTLEGWGLDYSALQLLSPGGEGEIAIYTRYDVGGALPRPACVSRSAYRVYIGA